MPVLTIVPPAKLTVPRTGPITELLKVQIQSDYHVNSNKPNEEFLIPLKLTWDLGALVSPVVEYPKPDQLKSDFSDQPLSVYTGSFELRTRFQRAENATLGPGFLTGKLRYQACNDKMCLPPRTLDVRVPLLVE